MKKVIVFALLSLVAVPMKAMIPLVARTTALGTAAATSLYAYKNDFTPTKEAIVAAGVGTAALAAGVISKKPAGLRWAKAVIKPERIRNAQTGKFQSGGQQMNFKLPLLNSFGLTSTAIGSGYIGYQVNKTHVPASMEKIETVTLPDGTSVPVYKVSE